MTFVVFTIFQVSSCYILASYFPHKKQNWTFALIHDRVNHRVVRYRKKAPKLFGFFFRVNTISLIYFQAPTWEGKAIAKIDDLLERFIGIRDEELGK